MNPQRETGHLHYGNYVLYGGFFITRNRYQSFNLSPKDSKLLVAKTLAGAQWFNGEPVFQPRETFQEAALPGKKVVPLSNRSKQEQNLKCS